MRYSLEQFAAPAAEPLTLAEIRTHLGLDGTNAEPAPAAPAAALASPAAPGNVDNGAHRYLATFVTADGETEAGTATAAVTVADKTVNGKVELTAIPLGGSAVTSRKLYRTEAGGSTYKLLATISNNTATTYTDNIADSALGAGAPSANTTADPCLTGLRLAARESAEAYLGRKLITQTWDWRAEYFPDVIELWGLGLVSSITHVKYYDSEGVQQTLAASGYQSDLKRVPARVKPAYNESWPVTRGIFNAVEVRAVCGYGAAASAVPQGIKQAMLIHARQLYDHRDSIITGASVQAVPRHAEWLMAPHRAVRIG